ncbi:MAG: YciI family protein, partial [Candidatus Binatia bacterium]
MLVFMDEKDGPTCQPGEMAAMKTFAAELASQGKLRRGAPLAGAGAHVRVRDGKAFVSDGPFAESKEVLGGFWIVDVASRAEAIDIARRTPHVRQGAAEVHCVPDRYAFADSGKGTPFLLVFRMEPGLTDPDGSKMREMIAFGEGLEREGRLLETAPLTDDPPPARIEPRGGKTLVIDGPFAEVKEAVGGYGLVRVDSRAEAIEFAKRYPHARWGPV